VFIALFQNPQYPREFYRQHRHKIERGVEGNRGELCKGVGIEGEGVGQGGVLIAV
jgi:hypothetical protein